MELATAFIVHGEILDTLQSLVSARAFGGKQQLEHDLALNSYDEIGLNILDYNEVYNIIWGLRRGLLHTNHYVLEGLERFYGVRES